MGVAMSYPRGRCLGLGASFDGTLTDRDRRQWDQVPPPLPLPHPRCTSAIIRLKTLPPHGGFQVCKPPDTITVLGREKEDKATYEKKKCLFSVPFIKQGMKRTSWDWPHHSPTGTVHEATTKTTTVEQNGGIHILHLVVFYCH